MEPIVDEMFQLWYGTELAFTSGIKCKALLCVACD